MFGAYGKTANSRLAENLSCLVKLLPCVAVITAAEECLSSVCFLCNRTSSNLKENMKHYNKVISVPPAQGCSDINLSFYITFRVRHKST